MMFSFLSPTEIIFTNELIVMCCGFGLKIDITLIHLSFLFVLVIYLITVFSGL